MRNRTVLRSMSVSCVAAVGLLAGCAGADLAKVNFERTTVGAGPSGQDQVVSGTTDDAALESAALRMVDTCAVLTGNAIAGFTKVGDPLPSGWGSCHQELVDAGGEEISVTLELGEGSVFSDQATGSVEGLPLVETSVDEESCYSTAVTQRDPDMGVSVLALHGPGEGDPCGTSFVVLRGVIQQLRQGAQAVTPEPGSLRDVDMCTVAGDEALKAIFDQEHVEGTPVGLHACQYSRNSTLIYVNARLGYPVVVDEGSVEIDLGGVKAVREPGTTETAECDVRWNHRRLSDSDAEIVQLSYYDYSSGTDAAAACARVTELAGRVVKTLPSA